MAARPTNIGIKAIELYIPSQASLPRHSTRSRKTAPCYTPLPPPSNTPAVRRPD
jgi:hypothetical protein